MKPFFSLCLVALVACAIAVASKPSARSVKSGIDGQCFYAPIVAEPVPPFLGPNFRNRYLAYNADLALTDAATGKTVATFTSNKFGEFKFDVPPGDYVLTATPIDKKVTGYPTDATQKVTVKTGKRVDLEIYFDTGIR